MTDLKRTNYTTGQFLTAADFQREQAYHLTLGRLHVQALHTPGVARGLTLAKEDDTHLRIGAGMAIDAEGRTLVLAEDAVLGLDGLPPEGAVWATITYAEVQDPADTVAIGGVDTPTATTERAVPALTPTTVDPGAGLSPPPAGATVLGLVTLGGGVIVAVDAAFRRVPAAAVLPPTVEARSFAASVEITAPRAVFDYMTGPQIEISYGAFGTLATSGQAVIGGPLYVSSGDLEFRNFWHALSGESNTLGFASIQNAHDYGALVILGRTIENRLDGNYRLTKMYDVVEINSVLNVRNFGGRRGMINVDGDIWVGGRLIASAKSGYVMDAFVNRLGDTLEAGDVVVIGQTATFDYTDAAKTIPIPEVDLAQAAYDTRVCGIVCEVHGIAADGETASRIFTEAERDGLDLSRVGPGQIGHMVTLGAYAFCKVDADIAPIAAGDLLTTSPSRGHAQKVLDRGQALGAVIGKALAPLAAGRGRIPVLVTLH